MKMWQCHKDYFCKKKLDLSYFNPVIELVKNVYSFYTNKKYVSRYLLHNESKNKL